MTSVPLCTSCQLAPVNILQEAQGDEDDNRREGRGEEGAYQWENVYRENV